jgi:hypothetical protein
LLEVEVLQEAQLERLHHEAVTRWQDADEGNGLGMPDPDKQPIIGEASQYGYGAAKADGEAGQIMRIVERVVH